MTTKESMKLDEIVGHLDKASLLADELAMSEVAADDPYTALAQAIDTALGIGKNLQVRPQVALDRERILGFLHDTTKGSMRERTYDEIEDTIGHDPREALDSLIEDGKVHVNHERGAVFYSRVL
jgi:hypothetical protein